MTTTTKQGVYTETLSNGSTAFYIMYRLNGKQFKLKLGTNAEGWTVTKAATERNKRIHTNIAPVSKKERVSLNTAAGKYLSYISHKSDYQNTLGRYNNHIKAILGDKLLQGIKPDDVHELKVTLSTKISEKTGRTLAPKTVDDIINLVHTIYRHHNKTADHVLTSPASDDKVERYRTDNSRLRFLSKDEINKLYWHITNRNDFTQNRNVKDKTTKDMMMFTKLSLTTGARLNSVLTIRVKDINFDTGVVDITNHKSDRRYKGFIGNRLLAEIEEWVVGLHINSYVIGRNDKPLHRSTISRRLKIVLDRVFNEGVTDNRERVVVHTFRHTFGSQLALQNTSIQQIMKLLDHTTIEQSLVYAKLSHDSGFDEVARLNIF